MPDPVVCHSGNQYAEYPVSFLFQGGTLPVDEILARWRTPTGKCFRVRAAGAIYNLFYDEGQDQWCVEQLVEDIHAAARKSEVNGGPA